MPTGFSAISGFFFYPYKWWFPSLERHLVINIIQVRVPELKVDGPCLKERYLSMSSLPYH
ncbi:MAG: hypothetical protein ACXVIB_00550 [Halobacteriota archaeon]